MAVEEVAQAHYDEQVALAVQAAAAGEDLWSQVDAAAIAASWLALLPTMTALVSAAQAAAAGAAAGYLAAMAVEQAVRPRPAGVPVPAAFAGIASDGRLLESLLYQPAIRTLELIGAGTPVGQAQAAGAVELDMIVRTQVADAGRAADGVALTADRAFGGYVRMLVPPSCSRCAVLAGQRYEWNAGFERHPRCDCRHIPAAEDTADDLTTDPTRHFDSLSEAEQDRVFTAAGAQAIRDGADISRVVNARRGMTTAADAAGRQRLVRDDQGLFTTTEAVTRRGRTPGQKRSRIRLMPESIYEIAGDDRDEAIRLLRAHGYLR